MTAGDHGQTARPALNGPVVGESKTKGRMAESNLTCGLVDLRHAEGREQRECSCAAQTQRQDRNKKGMKKAGLGAKG